MLAAKLAPIRPEFRAGDGKRPDSRSEAPVGRLMVENVSYSFPSGLLAVRDASFLIEPGEFVVIVGPSGCGKTTIQNIVAGLMPLQSGRVLVSGIPPAAGRKDVAYMFAQDALLPWRTVLRNALFGIEIHEGRRALNDDAIARAREMLAGVGLAGFEQAYPRQLSNGMRQRAALARTFLMDSPVLLMDEPFGALDAHTKMVLQSLVLKLWEQNKRTVLFITHDLAEAILLADRVLICTSRPGHIKADIRIDLARPRDPRSLNQSSEYHHLFQKVWHTLMEEMAE